MPFLFDSPTQRLHYTIHAHGHAPWLTFFHPLGSDSQIWSEQFAAFKGSHRLLAVDIRGHGRSAVSPHPYTLRDIALDVILLWDALGVERSHVCGVSLGGLIVQALCLEAATRIDRSVICCMAANGGSQTAWQQRMAAVRSSGLAALVPATLERWFTPAYRQHQADRIAPIADCFRRTSIKGYLDACQAIATTDYTQCTARMTGPMCVIAAEQDVAFPPEHLQRFANTLPHACFRCIPGAHLCQFESAPDFNRTVAAFLTATVG